MRSYIWTCYVISIWEMLAITPQCWRCGYFSPKRGARRCLRERDREWREFRRNLPSWTLGNSVLHSDILPSRSNLADYRESGFRTRHLSEIIITLIIIVTAGSYFNVTYRNVAKRTEFLTFCVNSKFRGELYFSDTFVRYWTRSQRCHRQEN